MKRISIIVSVILSLVMVPACTVKESDLSCFGDRDLVFYASNTDNPDTKTILQSDGFIKWKPQDKINVFCGTSSFEFTSTNNQVASEVEFHGSLEGASITSDSEFWAVYPFRETNTFDGTAVTLTLPHEQTAVAGSFDDDLFISIAKTKDYNLQFYNVCGGVKFSVMTEGVKNVVFKGNSSETIAGRIKVSFDSNGKPVSKMTVTSVSEITVSAPENTTFEVGRWYYIVCFPVSLSNGYSLTLYYSNNTFSEKKTSKPVTIKRSVWGTLDGVDIGLGYDIPHDEIWYTTTDEKPLPEYIHAWSYIDSYANDEDDYSEEAELVSNTYENGKGILKFDKPIIGIGQWIDSSSSFSTLKTLVCPSSVEAVWRFSYSLPNLEKVTFLGKLSKVDWNPFPRCPKLTFSGPNAELVEDFLVVGNTLVSYAAGNGKTDISINGKSLLDNGICYIGKACFEGCSTLDNVIVHDGITRVLDWAFKSSSIKTIEFNGPLAYIFKDAFSGCTSLSSIILPSTLIQIGEDAFNGCSSLQDITFPESLTTICAGAFMGSGLIDVKLPASLTSLGDYAFGDWITPSKSPITSVTLNSITPPSYNWSESDESYSVESWGPFPGNYPIYVPAKSFDTYKKDNGWKKYASRIQKIPAVFQYVDLGLSVKWATFNLGAYAPEEYGDYYAWGEIEPYYSSLSPLSWKDGKTGYNWSSYQWSSGSYDTITKYNTQGSLGLVDGKTVLAPEDDAAYVMLGDKWRMPSNAEWLELFNNCSRRGTRVNGVYGIQFIGPNGKSVFFPASGYYENSTVNNAGNNGSYWSLSLPSSIYGGASAASIRSDSAYMGTDSRCHGLSIRPVFGERIPVETVSLSASSIELEEGKTKTLTTTFSPYNAFDKSILWSSDAPTIASVNQSGLVTAVSPGTANITVTTIDGNKTASCKVTVYAAPVLDFNTNSYLIYKANPSGGWDARNENYYHYESYLSGFSAKVVEMKFQLASSSESYCYMASDNLLKDWYQELALSSTQLMWNQGDPTDYRCSISLSDAGVSRTSLITLRFDGTSKTLSINSKSYSVPFELFDFSYLLAEYNHESDEGVWHSVEGIPNGSKIYYIKGWDANGNLVYLGYPTKAINPKTSVEEYCWYTYWNKNTTYQFANDSLNQGGYNGYIP